MFPSRSSSPGQPRQKKRNAESANEVFNDGVSQKVTLEYCLQPSFQDLQHRNQPDFMAVVSAG